MRKKVDVFKLVYVIWGIICLGLSVWVWFNVVVKIPELIDAAIKAMGN
ncbi:hypothetical protein NHG29_01425 [Aerococcaceae bacterium NML160702]|nr:hypothetical protein [Aerococcaceae bacterium NML190073]MCW6681526.1 hypothetical protein [Aerococcaceae bacterium NML160702]